MLLISSFYELLVLLLAFKVSQAAVIDLNLPSSSELSISNAELGTTNGSLNITWNAAEDNPPSIRLELLCSTAGLVGSIEQVDGKDGHAAMTHIDFSRTPASIYSSCIIKALGVGGGIPLASTASFGFLDIDKPTSVTATQGQSSSSISGTSPSASSIENATNGLSTPHTKSPVSPVVGGAVTGGLILLIGLVVAFLILLRRRRRSSSRSEQPIPLSTNVPELSYSQPPGKQNGLEQYKRENIEAEG